MNKLRELHTFPKEKPNYEENLKGWFNKGNALLIKKFINSEMKIIFEFGTWLGLSADYILRLNDKCILVCIDTWEGDTSIGKRLDSEKLYNKFLVNMWKYRKRLIPVKMDGKKGMKYLYDLGIKPDMIYLDMGHSYEEVIDDLKVLMKYFPDVLILGDDILYWKGVAQAVKETVIKYNINRFEINQNCYALIPRQYDMQYKLKEIFYKPIDANPSNRKLAIIIGLTAKIESKILSNCIKHIVKYLVNIEYKIYVIQSKNNANNLGFLYNIGFYLASKDNYSTFLFQNINLLPDKQLIPYYKTFPIKPIQLCYNISEYNYEKYFLGSLLIQKSHFTDLNGFPNNTTNTESLDNEMIMRIKTNKIELNIPKIGNIIKNMSFKLLNLNEFNNIANKNILKNHSATWFKNGVNNIKLTNYSKKKLHNNVFIYSC